MANQTVRPINRKEFMSKLVDPYDPKNHIPTEVFSEPTKLGQPEINRAKEISVKDDNIRDYKVGIQDFDEAIMYYFKEVLKPTVIQNNTSKRVMKVRVSASIEKETDIVLDKIMQTGKYRNKSHAIEKAIILLQEEEVRQAKATKDFKK
jgi:hypothetical protein